VSRRALLVSLGLAAACALVFWQAVRFDFLNFDDNAYVYENPWVRHGFTVHGIVWAFTVIDYFYWQPVTWLSHMLDCQLFGLRPGWHHLVNVLIHTVNSILLFVVFRRLTGAFWRSAVLAALFALHPLRLESVVWIAERKDVLSAFWFLVTLGAYLRFAARPSRPRYWCVLIAFALGLMSKPMLMTTPLLLLLLDYWPLGRRAWAEKLPLFTMSAITLAVTYLGNSQLGVVNWADGLPLAHRLANALVSYAAYLGLVLWPRHLAILYPYRVSIAWWKPPAAAALLLAITWAALWFGRERRYLTVGWLWFVVGMMPAIGLFQVGRQAMADRFTYLPAIGIALMAVWGVGELLNHRRAMAALLAGVAVAALGAASLRHIGTWRDSVTVFGNAIAATGDNAAAEHYLAAALDDRGRFDDSFPHHAEAVRIEPAYFVAQYCYGLALERRGDTAGAAPHFAEAIRRFPGYADAHLHLGLDLKQLGQPLAARQELDQALQSGLGDAEAERARQELALLAER
jgi:protein O-mannosyl-transferase